MKSEIQQRHNECSIAALCVLNNLTQADYEALSDLIRQKLPRYSKGPHKFIDQAISIAQELGINVPRDYLCQADRRNSVLQWPTATPELFKGRGIAWIKVGPNSHVLAFENGVFADSTKTYYPSYEAMRVWYSKNLRKRIKLIKVYTIKELP